jgi:hypothetical protein
MTPATLLLLLIGCASTRPATVDPAEMSAQGHEGEATKEEREAARQSGRYNPNARVMPRDICAIPNPTNLAFPCWSSTVNPTAWHLREAEIHLRHAADHRAASAALREAEARACMGISEEDRDLSPLVHCEDIVRIDPLRRAETRGSAKALLGSRVVFRAIPGMSAEWLERVVRCHRARNAVLGDMAPDRHSCPLALKDVSFEVEQTWDGPALTIGSSDPEVAKQILERSKAFLVCERP